MPQRPESFLDRFAHRRAALRWARDAAQAATLPIEDLRDLRTRARPLRRDLDRLLHVAEGRLVQPLRAAPIDAPLGTDWTWRPESWSGPIRPHGIAGAEPRSAFGSEITLFHDCPICEIGLRQLRNTRPEHVAAQGVALDVLRFEGTFLSLVLDLPENAVQGLQLRHLIRLGTVIETERPIDIYARLNIRHGPNTEQVVRQIPITPDGVASVDFDLAYTKMNEKRVDRAWLDLIFDKPACNRVVLRDVTLGRRPRADV